MLHGICWVALEVEKEKVTPEMAELINDLIGGALGAITDMPELQGKIRILKTKTKIFAPGEQIDPSDVP